MGIELSAINVEIICNVHCFFNDMKKTAYWLNAKNLNFGGASPVALMNSGRSKKLLKWIEITLDENRRLTDYDKRGEK